MNLVKFGSHAQIRPNDPGSQRFRRFRNKLADIVSFTRKIPEILNYSLNDFLYLLKMKGHWMILNIKRDSSHSFGMTNDAVISIEGRNLLRQESFNFSELLSRYIFPMNLPPLGRTFP